MMVMARTIANVQAEIVDMQGRLAGLPSDNPAAYEYQLTYNALNAELAALQAGIVALAIPPLATIVVAEDTTSLTEQAGSPPTATGAAAASLDTSQGLV
jgi:hypothetical protein